MELFSKAVRLMIGGLAVSVGLAQGVLAQGTPEVAGKIEWGAWIDDDGCMHWWADGGTEGYMVPRRDPKTGKAVCTKPKSCLTESTDTFFSTASATPKPPSLPVEQDRRQGRCVQYHTVCFCSLLAFLKSPAPEKWRCKGLQELILNH